MQYIFRPPAREPQPRIIASKIPRGNPHRAKPHIHHPASRSCTNTKMPNRAYQTPWPSAHQERTRHEPHAFAPLHAKTGSQVTARHHPLTGNLIKKKKEKKRGAGPGFGFSKMAGKEEEWLSSMLVKGADNRTLCMSGNQLT